MTAKRRSKVSGAVKATTNHDDIIGWAEEKGAHPAVVRSTGIIRLHFPGFSSADALEPVGWDEFFEKFEEARLAFLYQDRGGAGRTFNKLVHRETAAEYGVPLKESRAARISGARRKKSSTGDATAEPSTRRKTATESRTASGRSSSRSASSRSAAVARGAQRSRPRPTRTSRVRSAAARPRATAPKQVSRKSSTKKRGRGTGKTRGR
ncbi:MAG TPA: hypothetical protein VHC69_05075 [Polyangiaceae bacterium]|nr:hypothetical protein [Polyangiaceae bacterium]